MSSSPYFFWVFCLGYCCGCVDPVEPNLQPIEWKVVRSGGEGHFQGLWFVDKDNGWAVGDSGRILHTSDGGDSWDFQESGTLLPLKCVVFSNPRIGWIGGGENSIGLTTNGGASWVWVHPDGEARRTFMALSFVDDRTGWMVDNFGGILHTEDGGLTWIPQLSGTTWAITSIQLLDSREGWATATNRVVLHTTDGGNHWSTSTLDSIDYCSHVIVVYTDIYFVDRSTGWIATSSAVSGTADHPTPILRTIDGGATWICWITPENDFISAIAFADRRRGWAGCFGGILYTSDGGSHWSYQLQTPGVPVVDVCLIDHSRAWAITFTGSIVRCDIP
jgi:photosystem II stability/assembly factor-like uncharacterized protein